MHTCRRNFLRMSAGALAGAASGLPARASQTQIEGFIRDLERIGDTARPRSLRVLVPNGGEANVAQVARHFTELSGIDVEISISDLDDINTRLIEDALIGAQEYDVALPATFGIPDLVEAGAIQALDPFLKQFPDAYDREGQLYSYGDRFNGQTYGFQTDGDVYLLFLREDMAAEARARGQAAFGENWAQPHSWAQLDAMMEALHAPSKGRYGGLLFRSPGYVGWEYVSRLSAEGRSLFHDDFSSTFSSPEAQKVIEDMRRSQESQHPATKTIGLFESWRLFKKIDVFATIGWGGSQKAFNQPDSPLRRKLAFSTLPKGSGPQSSYFNWGWSYVVSQASPAKEAAFLFGAMGVSRDVSTKAVRVREGYFDPFMAHHYDDPVIRDVYSDAFLEVHRKAMEASSPDLYIPGYGSYMATLNETVFNMIHGETPPAEGLRALQSDWDAITFEFGREKQQNFYSMSGVRL